jgi:hypothetical protein
MKFNVHLFIKSVYVRVDMHIYCKLYIITLEYSYVLDYVDLLLYSTANLHDFRNL